jgi:hypothetical protein
VVSVGTRRSRTTCVARFDLQPSKLKLMRLVGHFRQIDTLPTMHASPRSLSELSTAAKSREMPKADSWTLIEEATSSLSLGGWREVGAHHCVGSGLRLADVCIRLMRHGKCLFPWREEHSPAQPESSLISDTYGRHTR